jgi:hypothetical protein
MTGDGNMKIPDQLEQKILECGIFKRDDKSKPIGLIKLIPGKKTLSTTNKHLPYKPHILRSLISDLSHEIEKYCQDPRDKNLLNNLQDEFEKEFISFLKDWGLSSDNLNPHYAALIKKAKKYLHKELSGYEKDIRRLDTKDKARRGTMFYQMHRAFKEHTNINLTDINRYLAYILIACGIEKGSPKTVFNKTDRAFHRYPKSN